MSEYEEAICSIIEDMDGRFYELGAIRESIIRCRDCQWFNDVLDTCHRNSYATYDEETGDEIIAYAEASPEGFCAWGEAR